MTRRIAVRKQIRFVLICPVLISGYIKLNVQQIIVSHGKKPFAGTAQQGDFLSIGNGPFFLVKMLKSGLKYNCIVFGIGLQFQ